MNFPRLREMAARKVSGTYIALLLCAARSKGYHFGHLYSPQGGAFDTFGQLCCHGGREFDLFFPKMSKSHPMPPSSEGKALGTRLLEITPPSWKIPRRYYLLSGNVSKNI